MSVTKLADGLITIINGNVGIGVTNPTSKFSTKGDTTVSGILYATSVKITTANVNEPLTVANATSGKFLKWLNNVTNEATANWWGSSSTLKFDNGTAITTTGTIKFVGGVLLPYGRVVLVPCNYAKIGIYDPSTNTYADGPAITGTDKFVGGVLLPDGRVVLVPCNYAKIGIYDPSTNTYADGPAITTTGTIKFQGGVLLPDGRVVFVPYNYANVGIYNPSTNTYTHGPAITGTAKFVGGVLIPDGRVVLVPCNYATIGMISGFPSVPKERCLHPCFNKI